MNSSFKKELMYSNMFKAIIPSYVNYYFILKNLNKKKIFLPGCLIVKALILVTSLLPLALAEEIETRYPVPGLSPVTVNRDACELVVFATTKLVASSITSIVKIWGKPPSNPGAQTT